MEEQRKSEVKNKALEKIKLEKELQVELEKQKEEKELEAADYDDVDGFHLFNEQMDLPYQINHPDHHVDIEDNIENKDKTTETGDEVLEPTEEIT